MLLIDSLYYILLLYIDMLEEFEQAYLLLSSLYVEQGKPDEARELCKLCLKYNESCRLKLRSVYNHLIISSLKPFVVSSSN